MLPVHLPEWARMGLIGEISDLEVEVGEAGGRDCRKDVNDIIRHCFRNFLPGA